MRLLVTGGSGFIGTNLVTAALRRGFAVLNFDCLPPRNLTHAALWRKVDLLDVATLRRETAMFRPTHIVHLAARTDLVEKASIESYAVNTHGVSNLLTVMEALPDLQRTIFASTMLVCRYGHTPLHDCDYCPDTRYGESKAIGERKVRTAAKIPGSWSIVRPTSIWGPWCGPPYREFFLRVARGRYFQPGSAAISKALGFVGNAVYQLLRLLESPPAAVHTRTFYLQDYTCTTILEWAVLIQHVTGASRVRTIPMAVMRAAAYGGDILKRAGVENFPLTTFRLRNMTTPSNFDTSALQALTGPLPYDLPEGVRMTVEWFRRTGQLGQGNQITFTGQTRTSLSDEPICGRGELF